MARTLMLLALWAGGGRGEGLAGEAEVEMEVRNVGFDHASNSPVVVLQSREQGRALPIWIGHFEAQAIAMEIQGVSGPRPLTHDLMKQIVEQLDAQVERVVIDDLRGHTYYASIHLLAPGDRRLRIDSRPSDAIALALRVHKPILVNGALLLGEGAIDVVPEERAGAVGQVWGLTVQDVTAALAEVFALGAVDGVLVSDVAPHAVAGAVKRGDVITDVGGEAVHTLADLTERARGLRDGATVELGLRREGVRMRVSFAPSAP